jgi:hypothetical protein
VNATRGSNPSCAWPWPPLLGTRPPEGQVAAGRGLTRRRGRPNSAPVEAFQADKPLPERRRSIRAGKGSGWAWIARGRPAADGDSQAEKASKPNGLGPCSWFSARLASSAESEATAPPGDRQESARFARRFLVVASPTVERRRKFRALEDRLKIGFPGRHRRLYSRIRTFVRRARGRRLRCCTRGSRGDRALRAGGYMGSG